MLPSGPDTTDELEQIRQILAADMTTRPTTAPLPEPNAPLGDLARCVYDLVGEARSLRPQTASSLFYCQRCGSGYRGGCDCATADSGAGGNKR